MKTRGERIIQSVEKVYCALSQENPDRDEHWLLANTWLERYGSTREARRKGPEVMRFIAYNETHQFSILEPPESVRALALFLVYKELGAAAQPYAPEFGRIMEPVFRARADCCFFERYKEKNPGTLSECRAEAPGPFSLSSFLEVLESRDRDPQFRREGEGLLSKLERGQRDPLQAGGQGKGEGRSPGRPGASPGKRYLEKEAIRCSQRPSTWVQAPGLAG